MLRYHMQNITETIYKFISECPLFEGKRVGLNCLGAESGACALETSAAEPYVRVYTDGTAVRRAEFAFAVRGTPSRSVKENLPAVAVCEKLCAWLEEKADADELPQPIFDLRIKESGGFDAPGISEGRYTVRFEVLYL